MTDDDGARDPQRVSADADWPPDLADITPFRIEEDGVIRIEHTDTGGDDDD